MSAEYTVDVGATDVTADILLGRARVSFERGLDQQRVLSPPRSGSFDATAGNASGDYNPGVTPLARGQTVTVAAVNATITYPLWTGILDVPRHEIVSDFDERVELRATGMFRRVTQVTGLSTELYQNIRTDEAIAIVLEAVGLTASDYVLGSGATVLRYWWLDGEDAFSALRDLVASEGPTAWLYEDAQGRVVFRNRHAQFLETRSTANQAEYGADDLSIILPVSYDDGLDDVVNRCTVHVVRRSVEPLQVVWTLGEPVQMSANGIRSFVVRVQRFNNEGQLGEASELISDAVTPVEGVDFDLTSGSLSNVSLNRTSGASVILTINAGAGGAVLSDIQLRARPVRVASEVSVVNTVDASASIAAHGLRTYPFATRPDLSVELAQDFANAVVEHYQDGRPKVKFTTYNASEPALVSLLSREIGDRVRVQLPRLGVDEAHYIRSRSDTLTLGREHRVVFGCEQAVAVAGDLLQFDVPGKGFDQGRFTF